MAEIGGASKSLTSAYRGGARWVFFDGDNTLWHVEALYDRARQNLVRYLTESGANANDVENFQRAEDKRLFGELGYSAVRFATSFENTLRAFVGDAKDAQVQDARRMAASVFERPAEIDPDAADVLGSLKHSHKLALITAGEDWVQERRIAEFRCREMFDEIRIVERKTAALLLEMVHTLEVAKHASWVVGDSLRSDVMPALEAGLNAVLIANHNWIEIEGNGVQPEHLRVVDRLRDVVDIIAAPVHEVPARGYS